MKVFESNSQTTEGIRVSAVCPGNVVSRIFGTPILGESIDAKPPADAIPADEAARVILEGVANSEGIIAFPDGPKDLWRQYCRSPEQIESYLQDLARQRQRAFASGDAAGPYRPTGQEEDN